MEIIHYGKVTKEGKLLLSNKESFLKNLKTFFADKNVVITVATTNKRSLSQLRYYWGIVLKTISDATGYNPQELHEIFKYMYFGYETKEAFGQEIKVIPSLSNIDKDTMQSYLNFVLDYAKTKLSINIPENIQY